jgi:hypothetical protein
MYCELKQWCDPNMVTKYIQSYKLIVFEETKHSKRVVNKSNYDVTVIVKWVQW